MPDPIVIDRDGQIRSLSWARDKYGPFVIYRAPDAEGAAWRLTSLREKNDSTFIATAKNDDGGGAPGTRICFYWPDAPTCSDAGPLGAPFDGITPQRAVTGYADVFGNVGFGMGPGATYFPANGERGPHAAWIHGPNTRSDIFLGVGMIPEDHLHLDATWTLTEDEQDPDDLRAALVALAAALRALADVVEVIANG